MSYSHGGAGASLKNLGDFLRSSLAELLRVEGGSVIAGGTFAEMGVDSTLGTQWVAAINARCRVSISISRLYDYPSIEKLASYLAGEIKTAGGVVPRNVSRAATATTEPVPDMVEHSQAAPAEVATRIAAPSVKARARSTDATAPDEAIAIIGMSGRFPQADSLEEFWEKIAQGAECITEVPGSRWSLEDWYDADPTAPGKTNSRWMGVLDGADCFDASFFNITPAEAQWMDARQRIFLQSCWSGIEDAGIDPLSLSESKCGVFVGCKHGDYGNGYDTERLNAYAYLGESSSILAARISYFLNLKGPSVAIDTACSSSLVAIAQACDSLNLGRSDLALAGGINLLMGPAMHVMATKAGMLSKRGRCFTFDSRADGIVPGEGVGVVVLKRYADALRDGDRICGLIRGWGVNQDGKTNGITAPSVNSQIELQQDIYQRAGINAATIGLVEAHGTGTKLGDPIEVEALTASFRSGSDRRQFCALGSVKSNIGHLLSAAGIAGVIKVLLALQHRALPPSANFEQPNEHIDFANSPFYVNTALRPWQSVPGMPRRAAVSSFGFSGTNAHIVIEEHVTDDEPSWNTSAAAQMIVPLSAKRAEHLQRQAAALLEAIRRTPFTDRHLAAIAYTLQTGRAAFEHRVAFVVRSIEDLKRKLARYLAGDKDIEDTYAGQVSRERARQIAAGDEAEDLDAICDSWIVREALTMWAQGGTRSQFLELWVTGASLDWSLLYGQRPPGRLRLPTYPFERTRFPLKNAGACAPARTSGEPQRQAIAKPPMPAVSSSRNTEAASASGIVFTGREFFLADHVVNGNATLPGVMYLQLAHAAAKARWPAAQAAIEIRSVVFLRPLVVNSDSPVTAHVDIRPIGERELAFEIHSAGTNGLQEGAQRMVHCEGRAFLVEPFQRATLDVQALLSGCGEEWSHDQCYERIAGTGLCYGPGHRSIRRLHKGVDGRGEPYVLAELELPPAIAASYEDYQLHPALLDGALQSSMGLRLNPVADGSVQSVSATLPFVLDKLQIFGRCPARVFAHVRRSPAHRASERTHYFDIDLCDAAGRVCLRFTGYTSRTLATEPRKSAVATLLFGQTWKPSPKVATAVTHEAAQQWIFFAPGHAAEQDSRQSLFEQCASRLAAERPAVRCVLLQRNHDSVAQRINDYSVQLLRHIKELRQQATSGLSIQLVLADSETPGQQLLGSLAALLRVAGLEHSKISTRTITVEAATTAQRLLTLLSDGAQAAHSELRDVGGQWLAPHWEELPASVQSRDSLPWKDKGIYLITGGAGGLGLLIAADILRTAQKAVVVLAGRSALTAERARQLESLRGGGGRIEYRQADIADAQSVFELVDGVRSRYGRLNGVIHAAGVRQDSFIWNKTADEVAQVLAPKVAGCINLDTATAHTNLDFFILFSSVAAVFGNPGQADYATANAFLDRYAEYRHRLVQSGQRYGRTVSIDWPLWADGGMQVDAATLQHKQRRGLEMLDTNAGLQALYQAFAGDCAQVMVLSGEPARLRELLQPRADDPVDSSAHAVAVQSATVPSIPAAIAGVPEEHGVGVEERVRATVMSAIGNVLQVGEQDIDMEAEWSEFGCDSISLTQLANEMNRSRGLELRPSIFFEYSTPRAIAEYLATDFAGNWSVAPEPEPAAVVAARAEPPPAEPRQHSIAIDAASVAAPTSQLTIVSSPKEAPSVDQAPQNPPPQPAADTTTSTAASQDEPIAVIGMSARLPQAADIGEFWDNLLREKDCVTEVPPQRWDWREIYGDPATEPNKTQVKWGAFIEGVDHFDPLFFGISPREAEIMNPQQRLLMIELWNVLEDAGYSAESISGTRTAILVGTGGSSYAGYTILLMQSGIPGDGYVSTAIVPSVGPNRMSYFLNVHGPSEPIETACSSALVAIHRAVRAIQKGDCDMALVGGVNTILTPHSHINYSKAGMLSKDGRCKTFSAQANGYARGEGIGMLFLKRVSAAQRDGDHIYGLIRGSAENHGGRANSLTAPNPKAQAELIKAAYREARIDPRTVTYIEAHGTGTPLGDPIEINGLKSAFKDLYEETGDAQIREVYCGIGSVKTNIGHLEVAAGAAGVIKVLLQMQHRRLVKSLHCDEINPYIQLQDSPFYIVRESGPWLPLRDAHGKSLPLRAGVSSFGFGGVNAHVVLEEYVDPCAVRTGEFVGAPALIVLSAKTAPSLRERARRLRKALDSGAYAEVDLPRIAYTLQVGRDAMEERLAFLAETLEQLKQKLDGFLAEPQAAADLYRGTLKRGRSASSQSATDALVQQRQYAQLLQAWVQGEAVDWTRLYGESRPRRISLPAYPFAKDRYWLQPVVAPQKAAVHIDPVATTAAASPPAIAAIPQPTTMIPHPLLHADTSGQGEQRFTTRFTGEEFFLADHVIKGSRVLPGVCSLEMARAAVTRALGLGADGSSSVSEVRLKNVVWLRPIVVDAVKTIHVSLRPQPNGEIEFEIHADSVPGAGPDPKGQRAANVHCRGSALIANAGASPPRVDVRGLSVQCTPIAAGVKCYEAFKRLGIDYGPAHQGLVCVSRSTATADGFVLAELTLPNSARSLADRFVLHPSVMDSALQAAIGLTTHGQAALQGQGGSAMLPFALEELRIHRGTPSRAFVLIRHSARGAAASEIQKLDIDICDEGGEVCVQMKGFSSRALASAPAVKSAFAQGAVALYRPEWSPAPVAEIPIATNGYRVVLCATDADQARNFEKHREQVLREWPTARCTVLSTAAGPVDAAMNALATVRECAAEAASGRLLLQVVIPQTHDGELLWGFAGLLRTAQLEHPKLVTQIVGLDFTQDAQAIVAALKQNAASARGGEQIRHRQGIRESLGWQPLQAIQAAQSMPWKPDGVYLITGGLGGLGLLFAKEIAQRTGGCRLLLAGRSELTQQGLTQIATLQSLGCHVDYRRVDLGDAAAVRQLVTGIKSDWGRLDGVMHCAGVVRDSLLANKTRDDMVAVLRPKMAGIVNLDDATKDLALEFFIVFSSVAGALGNMGQADYALGNAFMDAYARRRDRLRLQGERAGRTLSINWPLWESGGMQLTGAALAQLQQRGVQPLASEDGIRAFYDAWASQQSQVLVLAGNISALEARMTSKAAAAAAPISAPPAEPVRVAVPTVPPPMASSPSDEKALRTWLEATLSREVSTQLKVNLEDIEVEAKLSEFGFDSIGLTEFATNLNRAYGLQLTPAIFFEYPTLQQFAEFLAREHGAQLAAEHGGPTANVAIARDVASLPDVAPTTVANPVPLAVSTVQIATSIQNTVATSEQLEAALAREVSAQLKVALQDVDPEAKLSEFGFDSIGLTEFANTLNRTYQLTLTPAIFFEYPTLRQFSEYLLTEHAALVGAGFAAPPVQVDAPVMTPPVYVEQVMPAQVTPEPIAEVAQTVYRFAPAAAVAVQTASQSAAPATREPIAIVGMSGRFPQARDLEQFWGNLQNEKDCVSEIPEQRWDWRAVYGDPVRESNKTNVKWGAFIDGIDEFDPLFFGMSPREAEETDPQQRLLFTYAWHAIEDAGYSAESLSGTRTAVFVGTSNTGYDSLIDREQVPLEGYSTSASVPSVGPNRTSYFLNLRGPSQPVDTACSSSLIALHRAVRAIHSGDCDMALVGGVNTLVTPRPYITFSKAGMLSLDGRCKTFSAAANGYVRGEGVGMLFLKKLGAAERDGDHIYGVIRGTAENHGGRANSLTSPNPKAQAELLKTVYREAGVDPRTVSYIEAHGTGTSLGDPIEINGLKNAFKELYADSGDSTVQSVHCGIGSVKTNIGHLELAAGIAGVIKVLLQMQHRRLVKTLHCDEINPYIQLQGSPFYIVQHSREWRALQDEQGASLPRRAGVSSFGFGGANAHVVLEEYVDRRNAPSPARTALVAIVLSAKTPQSLRERAEQLDDALAADRFTEADLPSIAYTLQVGRDAMEYRLAMIVGSLADLREKLRAYLAAEQGIAGLYAGDAKSGKESLSLFSGDDDMRVVVESWLKNGKFTKVLDLWTKGLNIEWALHYGHAKPRRVSLPTYPFAKDRYWVRAQRSVVEGSRAQATRTPDALHPLLHVNTSNLARQRFTSTFSGTEFFLRDHQVNGEPILPAVCQLEMVRAAVLQSQDDETATDSIAVRLRNVVWSQPIGVSTARTVHVALSANDASQIEYEIYSIAESGDAAGSSMVHGQGLAIVTSPEVCEPLDLGALESACTAQLDVAQCYETYETKGIKYGASHRSLKTLQVGTDGAGQGFVLAALRLPECVSATQGSYELHPSLLDGALQAAIGLSLGAQGNAAATTTFLPFALDELVILAATPAHAYAYIRPSAGSTDAAGMRSLDIDICDEHGGVCAYLRGFRSRSLQPVSNATDTSAEMWLAPCWDVEFPEAETLWPEPGERVVIVGATLQQRAMLAKRYPDAQELEVLPTDSIETLVLKIQRLGLEVDHIVWCAPAPCDPQQIADQALIDAQEAGVLSCFRLIKALLQLGYSGRELGWSVVTWQTHAVGPDRESYPAHASIHGLMGSLAKEYANWNIRLLDLPAAQDWPLDEWLQLPPDPEGNAWAFRCGEWYRQQLLSCQVTPAQEPQYRRGGVYVFIGGAGGIGEVFSEYLLREYRAHVIWIGRRELDAQIQAKLDRLTVSGLAPQYICADAADRASLQRAYEQIKQQHEKVHGVVHAAIALLDKSLANMDEERFRAGLRAKVDVSVRLAEVFAREPLDWFGFFSSLQSFTKAAGQSNYAAGCTFNDAYANQLARVWPCPVKVINWGYWGSVGIVASATHRERMQRQGFGSIEPAEGINAMAALLAAPFPQLVFLKTSGTGLLAGLGSDEIMTYIDLPAGASPQHTSAAPGAEQDTSQHGVGARK